MKITSDLHVHTLLSSCASRTAYPQEYIDICKKTGITTIGFADHLWDPAVVGASPWYAPQDIEHVKKIRSMIEDTEGINVLFGCETEYTGKGKAAVSKAAAQSFDYVLIPPNHFHMKDFVIPAAVTEIWEYKKYLLEYFMEICEIDLGVHIGIAHPFMPLGVPDVNGTLAAITDAEYKECFEYAKKHGKSVEIQTGIADADNPEFNRMLKIADGCGCVFHFASDAHDTENFGGAHEKLGVYLDKIGVKAENTYPS